MDADGKNRIIFGDGITAAGIKAYRTNWNDLTLTFEGLESTLTLRNYTVTDDAKNYDLIFADGTVVNALDADSPLRTIYGTDNSDYSPSVYGDGNVLIVGDGYDQAIGGDGNDKLYGGANDDRLIGNGGNDYLDGGKGSDYLAGGEGSDTYVFAKGSGTDTVDDNSGVNTIKIEGYNANQVKAYRTNWNDITLEFAGSEDKLTITGFYVNEQNRNFNLVFGNGQTVSATASNSPLRTIYGTENSDWMNTFDNNATTLYGENGDDGLNGGNGADKLYGGAGADQLYGNAGNDTLSGGAGSDRLMGGDGNDTYTFNLGDGQDIISDSSGTNTISLGAGITEDKVKAYRTDWNNLTVMIDGTDDKFTIENWFGSETNRSFNLNFANGKKYSAGSPENPLNYVYATAYDDWTNIYDNGTMNGMAGNDTINGSTGANTLIGGAGNDTLNGDLGDDTYIFNLGDGNDTIFDFSAADGNDKLKFGEGIETDDLIFSQEGSNLKIAIAGTEDSVTITNHFGSDENKIETFISSDGAQLTGFNVELLIQSMSEFTADTGMTASEAAQENNQTYSDIVNQMWVSKTVA
jgi:Ca2+-binding RTX toxin-like protein